MRFYLIFYIAIAMALTATRPAVAAPSTSLDISARRIDYFSNRFIVTGDGNVRVRLSDGTVVSGETFAMDLKMNRYVIAGNVHLDGTDVHESGAAFSGFPDLDKSYFLPGAGVPDRWTYNGLDFTHPVKGRDQPGDAFFIPEVSGERPFILATAATVIPKTNVQFTNSQVYTFGAYVPTHGYVLNFSTNPNFAQNAFAGATADVGVPYHGARNAISAFHLRYDTMNHAYLSFDQHFAWDRDYVVASVNPLTREQKQFNLIGYKRFSPKLEGRAFFQLSTLQHAFLEPENASAFSNLQVTFGLPHSSLGITVNQYNAGLLANEPTEQGNEHPIDARLSWTGSDHRIGTSPLNFRLRSGMAYSHDGFHNGLYLVNFAGTPVTTLWQQFAGATLYTSSIRVGRDTFFNATFDKQRQWFSLPHHVDMTNTTASVSKIYGTKLALLGAYTISNVGDYYGARQAEFYPPYGPITTQFGTYGGYSAFRGFTTSRSLVGSAIITPNAFFALNLTVQRNVDFPAPIPGQFGQPPGQLGRLPLQLTGDVRIRLARQILLDLNRSYYFNFGDQRWQPQFQIQFAP